MTCRRFTSRPSSKIPPAQRRSFFREGPHLLGSTARHGLLFGCALDAQPTPEWIVVLDNRQPEPVETAQQQGSSGVSLTEFAQPICLQERLEVSLVRLLITVQQLTFPLCLVAASGLRPKEPQDTGDIPAWPLRNIPGALADCSIDMPSGLTLWPFTDDPHITQEGFVLRGPTPEIRDKVYRFLLQREIPSYVVPCVREHLSWLYDNGPTQFFDFLSLEHLSFQAGPPPAKRRAANLISPQPAASRGPPTPPDFPIFQDEPPRQPGVYASQAACPQVRTSTDPTPPTGA